MKIKSLMFASVTVIAAMFNMAHAEEIGSVDTVFNALTPNHKIVIEVFDDPLVKGVSCYVSRAKTGGAKSWVGMAEDPSDASVACRQIGPIEFTGKIPKEEKVFKESASILFKTVQVVRMVDPKRQTLIYLIYADKLKEGSPKNSITAVPVGKPIPMK